MPTLQAIVFDLDDTLYSEREYVRSGFKAVAVWIEEHLNLPWNVAFQGFLELFDEGKRGNIFDLWLKGRGIDPEPWVPRMVAVYRQHRPHIAPYQGVFSLLSRLRRIYRLGIVTDGSANVQKRKIEALGLAPYFDAIVFSDELGKAAWKPSALPFRVVLKRLKAVGNKSIYVADNPLKDFLGACAVGMWTIRVRHPLGLYSQIEPPSPEYGPDVEITTIGGLEGVVAEIETAAKRGG